MTTINELCPGNSGQLHLMQAMLRLKEPSLKDHPKDTPLDPDLEQRLRNVLKEMKAG